MAGILEADVDVSLTLGAPLGTVSRRVFGQFSEHLHDVIQGGLAAELLVNRKFEAPGVHGRLPAVAPGWEAIAPDGVSCRRGMTPFATEPGHDCFHVQMVNFRAGRAAGSGGIRQGGIPLDAGSAYLSQVRCQVAGDIADLVVALHGADGQVIASTVINVPPEARIASDDLGSRRTPAVLLEAEISAPTTVDQGWFSVTADPVGEAPASLMIQALSLMPRSAVGGLHAGAAEALRDLPAVVVKWPGGCFADNYDWRLGIGPRDQRHGAPDYAWGTWDENDFGTDEFLRWCELTGTEPYLCVNHGTGTPELAAAWVEYCNGPATSPMGALRAANGHAEPYDVKLWAIGNEVFGFWERGSAPPDVYAAAVRQFAAAMRAVDPAIRIAAQGDTGPYTRALLPAVSDVIDLLSVHHYSVRSPADGVAPYIADARAFETALADVVDAIRSTPGAGAVRIALDEWGWTPAEAGPIAGVFSACVLNAVSRLAPHVEIGCHCCVINPLGPIQRRGERLVRNPMYDVFQLYERLHRATAHRIEGLPRAVDGVAYSDDRGVSILLVNTSDQLVTVGLPDLRRPVTLHRIAGGKAGDEVLEGQRVGIAPFGIVGVASAGED